MKLRKICIMVLGAFLLLTYINVSAEPITDTTDDLWHWSIIESDWKFNRSDIDKPNIDITSLDYSLSDNDLTLIMTLDRAIDDESLAVYIIYFGNNDSINYHFQYVTYNDWQYRSSYWGSGIEDYVMGYLTDVISGDGKTITATFEIADLDPNPEIWGYAMEYDETSFFEAGEADQIEYWVDIAPFSFEEEYLGETSDEDDEDDEDIEDADDDGVEDSVDNCPNVPNPDQADSDNDGIGDVCDEPDEEDDDVPPSDDDGSDNTPGFEVILVIGAIALIFFLKRKSKLY